MDPARPPHSGVSALRVVSNPLKGLYLKMLRMAEHPRAEAWLVGVSFAEASFFPIPPDPLLLALGAGRPKRSLRYATLTTLASVSGALLGYAIGVFLMDSLGGWLLDLYDPQRVVWERIVAWYQEYGTLALFVAALTPIPYKVFTIASGALAFPLLPFVGFSLFGRGLRFYTEGLLLYHFGYPIVRWIDRWFNWVVLGFAVLAVGGFLALTWL